MRKTANNPDPDAFNAGLRTLVSGIEALEAAIETLYASAESKQDIYFAVGLAQSTGKKIARLKEEVEEHLAAEPS